VGREPGRGAGCQAEGAQDKAEERFERAEARYTSTLERFSPAVGAKRGRGDELDMRDPKRAARTGLEKRLARMWQAMQNAEVRPGRVEVPGEASSDYAYIELPVGAPFVAGGKNYGSKLLVRPVYATVFDEWWGRARDDETRGEILIGTPGIGKSTFLLYALFRLSKMIGDGVERVVYQYTLFEGDTVVCHPTLKEKVLGEIGNSDTVYLVDGSKKGDVNSSEGPFFVASSPNKEVWKRVVKDEHTQPRCAPVCTLGEMLAIRELCFADTVSVGRASRRAAAAARLARSKEVGRPSLFVWPAPHEEAEIRAAGAASGNTDASFCHWSHEAGEAFLCTMRLEMYSAAPPVHLSAAPRLLDTNGCGTTNDCARLGMRMNTSTVLFGTSTHRCFPPSL